MSDDYKKGDWIDVSSKIQQLDEESWRIYWKEMTGEEAETFLKDPKTPLVNEGIIKEDYRIQSEIINNEVVNPKGPHCSATIVFHREKLVKFMSYRHAEGTPDHS